MNNIIKNFSEHIKAHAAQGLPLVIQGSGSKAFYGGETAGDMLDVRPYRGIIDYQPKELVLTVRAGTPLADIEAELEAAHQMLPFEPPHFGRGATIGGVVATGLSGPRRAYSGAVRDFVLGTRILNGQGEDLRFGGRVIKNVAGYDVSRLMCGALGTLGVLLDISFKVLPQPAAEVSLRFEMDEADAIRQLNRWAGQPLPLTASSWHEEEGRGLLTIRLSGTRAGVQAARQKLGGELLENAAENAAENAKNQAGRGFWADLREHKHAFFQSDAPLWRVSLPPTTPPLASALPQWIEWGGALRWLKGEVDATALRVRVEALGGHVTLFRAAEVADKSVGVFHHLQPVIASIHRKLKAAFDPVGILNPGRMDNF